MVCVAIIGTDTVLFKCSFSTVIVKPLQSIIRYIAIHQVGEPYSTVASKLGWLHITTTALWEIHLDFGDPRSTNSKRDQQCGP
eukprot:2544208-Ditylum_brightwellii.AAC.1